MGGWGEGLKSDSIFVRERHKSLIGWAKVRKRSVEAREGKCRQLWDEPCWDGGLRIRTVGRGFWEERRRM